MSTINLDFPLAKAGGFVSIQQIFKQYLRNTFMVLTRDIPSTLQKLLVNMPFLDKDDNTAAYPTYLPVPVLVSWNITSTSTMNDEQKSQAVGYACLGPCRKSTTGDASTMERFLFPDYSGMHMVKVNAAYLWFNGPGDAGDGGDFSNADDGDYGGGDGDGEGSEMGNVESEGSVGSEESVASYDSYGSEGSQGSQGSQARMSSAENGHGSDDEQEDSEEEEEDWDDDDDPYGEVEDDDIEFD